MAGYKIFKATSYDDTAVATALAEIGASRTASSVTFSDGKSVSVTNPGNSNGNGFWFVADDDAHLFIMFNTYIVDNIFFASRSTEGNQPMPLLLVAENIEGNIISYSGKDMGSSNSMLSYFNVPRLNYNSNNNPSKTEIALYPFVGGYVYGNPNAVPTTFKTLFVNYYRYFNFGDIVVDSNGNRYIGMGWVLHKIGG